MTNDTLVFRRGGSTITPRLTKLLTALAPHMVVIGSVARGSTTPKDLDLLFDFDSPRARQTVTKLIEDSGVPYDSYLIGSWFFDSDGVLVEILPFHEGKSYRSCRRYGSLRTILGVELVFAPARFVYPKPERNWNT